MKASLPRFAAWASVSSCRTCPAALISATAIRTDDVPISITATCRVGKAAGESGVSRVREDIDFRFWILDFGFDFQDPGPDPKSKIGNPKWIASKTDPFCE